MHRRDEVECQMIDRAIEIAVTYHKGQRDRAGDPYVLHVLRVMAGGYAQGFDSEMLAAAVLHDIVEDTDLTLEDLRREGMTPRVIELVDAMTRPEEEDYDAYIERLSAVPDAPRLKFLDLGDNMGGLVRLDAAMAEPLFLKYLGGRQLLTKLLEQSAG